MTKLFHVGAIYTKKMFHSMYFSIQREVQKANINFYILYTPSFKNIFPSFAHYSFQFIF
jgi:hypothetical protein